MRTPWETSAFGLAASRLARALALLGSVWILVGCQLVGGSRPAPEVVPAAEEVPELPPPPVEEAVQVPEGEFRGVLVVEGESMQAHLDIILQGRGTLFAALEGPVEFHAEGPGTLQGSEVRLELSYGGECPGTMVLTGDWDPDSQTFSGIVRASDCTGPGQGTFRFSRFLLVFSHQRP